MRLSSVWQTRCPAWHWDFNHRFKRAARRGARCPHLLQVTESRCSTTSCSEACFKSAIVSFTHFGGGSDATGSFSIASRVVSAVRWRIAQLLPSTQEVRAGTVSGNSQNYAAVSATPSASVFKPMNHAMVASTCSILLSSWPPRGPQCHAVRQTHEWHSRDLGWHSKHSVVLVGGAENLWRQPWRHKCTWQGPLCVGGNTKKAWSSARGPVWAAI